MGYCLRCIGTDVTEVIARFFNLKQETFCSQNTIYNPILQPNYLIILNNFETMFIDCFRVLIIQFVINYCFPLCFIRKSMKLTNICE